MGNRPKPRNRRLIAERALNKEGEELLGRVSMVNLPEDEKEVLKEVPAVVEGVNVGTAVLYDDGSVDVIFDPDAPEWAYEKIRETAKDLGIELPEKKES